MKLSVECAVEGQTRLEQSAILTFKDIEYEFVQTDGLLTSLRITKPMPAGVEYYARYVFDGAQLSGMDMNGDKGVLADIMERFKDLESMLGFEFEIRRIDWQTPKLSMVPETPEEQARVELKDFFKLGVPRHKPMTAGHDDLIKLVRRRRLFAPLTIIKSFWREGRNEVEAERYIPAFVSFYFILEALYANGQFGKKEVVRAFEKSAELTDLVRRFIDDQLKGKRANDYAGDIARMLQARNKQLDVHGLLYLLVETRGELSHFVQESRRAYGNPFRNEDYEAIAITAYMLVTAVIYQKRNNLLDEARHVRDAQK